ncbi:MAG: hypothetical protein UY28_C0004G0036 [Candidatus Amesbacteria bacterium GW2011_GWB1_48_13]|uniref:Uncharacterized protein n=1 Tax=Candidatus Amesbacteria bacterium GW2011_GWB1_48_13 TaxID=1618362 RepID=A0A0G1X6Q9_9BACT|nr:MAG: hypothetical protein UY28_C0004G0036 [Candidatus Amesbacteria bacterium GW2011_GWB1_48_13]
MPNGTDWSSMASSLIPGVLGLLGGGGPMGALAGYAHGQESQDKYRREMEKRNQEIEFKKQEMAFKNTQVQQQQQQIDIQRQQEERLGIRADAENKYVAVQTQTLDRALQNEESAVQGLSPEELRLYHQLGKEGYRKDRLQRMGIESAGRFLPTMDPKLFPTPEKAQDFARAMGDHLGGYLLEKEKQKGEAGSRRRFYSTSDGRIYDDRTGDYKEEPATMSPRERMQAKAKLLEAYNKLPEIQRMTTPFNRWMSGPDGLAARKELSLIDDEQFADLLSFSNSEEKRGQEAAYSQMFINWQKKQGRFSAKNEEAFREYLQTQKGSDEFEAFISSQRMKGSRGDISPTSQPAAHPVEMAPKVETPTPKQPSPTAPKTYEEWKRMRGARQ